MRGSLTSAVAALALVAMLGGETLAAAPAAPQLTGVWATWTMELEEDGVTSTCHLRGHATIDPSFTRGAPVYWRASMHFQWVGPGGEPIAWRPLDSGRLARGQTSLDTIGMGFCPTSDGYYVVDGVRFELVTRSGRLLSSMEASAPASCLASPGA